MLRVRKDADVGQADRVGDGSHRGLVLRSERACGSGAGRRGQACELGFLVGEGRSGGGRLASSGVVQSFRCSSGGACGANEVLVVDSGEFYKEQENGQRTRNVIDVAAVVQRVVQGLDGGVGQEGGTFCSAKFSKSNQKC